MGTLPLETPWAPIPLESQWAPTLPGSTMGTHPIATTHGHPSYWNP